MSKFGNENKVHAILRDINEYERRLLSNLMSFSENVRDGIKRHKISKKEFCEAIKIKESRYSAFCKGAYNYDLHVMVSVEVLFKQKEKQLIDKTSLVKVVKTPNL